MPDCNANEFITKLGRTLSESPPPDEFLLQTALNEAWFSNTLAWLLDPRGSHRLGVSFCQDFVSLIGRCRIEPEGCYFRRATFLKRGKEGPGVGTTGFSFQNAAALREYYLSCSIDRTNDRGNRFCDVVFLDLDSSDSFFLAVENKLFTSDHVGQLSEYREAIETKYARATVREFVYLTLCGDQPVFARENWESEHWVRLSWTRNVLDILENLAPDGGKEVHPQVIELKKLLCWLRHVTDLNVDRVSLKRLMLRAAAECLYEELVRLDKPDGGQWELEKTKCEAERCEAERISYTVRTAAYLTLELTPGLTVTVQGRRYNGKAEFDKIVVPFGAHPDQVINLLDVAARDIYHKFFGKPTAHLGTARRLRTTWTEKEKEHWPLFQFINQFRYALKSMLLQSAEVRSKVGIRDEHAAEAQ